MTADNKGPFDIQAFREEIGDNREVEKMILEEFIRSAEETLSSLERNIASNDNNVSLNQLWKSLMHKLKGTALSIGAMKLSKTAQEGQEMSEASLPQKRSHLEKMLGEYCQVKDYIEHLTGK